MWVLAGRVETRLQPVPARRRAGTCWLVERLKCSWGCCDTLTLLLFSPQLLSIKSKWSDVPSSAFISRFTARQPAGVWACDWRPRWCLLRGWEDEAERDVCLYFTASRRNVAIETPSHRSSQPTQQEGRGVNDNKQRKMKPVKKKEPDLTQCSRGLSLKAQFVFLVHATAASCHFPSASGREAWIHLAVYSQEQTPLMLLLWREGWSSCPVWVPGSIQCKSCTLLIRLLEFKHLFM